MSHILPTFRPPHTNLPVFRHGGIGKIIQLDAISPRITESAARSTGVYGTARRINVLTESLLALGTASQIRLTRIEGDVTVILN